MMHATSRFQGHPYSSVILPMLPVRPIHSAILWYASKPHVPPKTYHGPCSRINFQFLWKLLIVHSKNAKYSIGCTGKENKPPSM